MTGELSVDALGKVLFGSAEVMLAGQPGRISVRWLEGSCKGARSVRAVWTAPDGTTTSIDAVSLTAPFKGVLEASFELTPQAAGQHVLEAFLEPGAVQATVEVIVAADRTNAPVFEEALSPSMVSEDFDRRWVARTTAGLLIVSGQLSRGGLAVAAPPRWPTDPSIVVAVGNTVWTLETATVARWSDDGAQLVLDGAAAVPSFCTPHFASAEDFFCSTADARVELRWNGTTLDTLEVATPGSRQMAFEYGDRRFVVGKDVQTDAQRNVLCEVEPQTQARTCHATVNLHGLSPAGALVRDWTINTVGVLGREGRAWWYSSGGFVMADDTSSGLVDDQAVALEPSFVNADLPPDHESLVMTATSAGLLFQRYRLGPPLAVGQTPHRVLAILHDWLVVSRSGDRHHVFFIARR